LEKAEGTQIGDRQSITEGEYKCHVYIRPDCLVGVSLTDHEYPHRVAHTLLTKVLDDFTLTVPRDQWTTGTEVAGFAGSLEIYMKKYQDPYSVDPMMKMEKDIDETKIILHQSIEAVLERDEKLHDLVAKSEELSEGSKLFYKTVPKQGCCSSLN
jgi:synaptobrevin family protein YKT6